MLILTHQKHLQNIEQKPKNHNCRQIYKVNAIIKCPNTVYQNKKKNRKKQKHMWSVS